MAFRQLARTPAACEVRWEPCFRVETWTAGATEEIAGLLMVEKHFAELAECAGGTLADARHYVDRARRYVERELGGDAIGYEASSLVYHEPSGELVGICLCCGSSVYDIEVHPDWRRRGLATRMLQRALSVHAAHGTSRVDLWRNDDSPGAGIYERLGFVPTGLVE